MTYYVYKRVSTIEQDLQRQTDAIAAFLAANNVDGHAVKVYEDKATGTNTRRVGLKKMLRSIDKGDIVVVSELDRLGRNWADMRETITTIRAKGATLQILNLPQMNAGDARLNAVMNDFILDLMSYVSELEYDKIRKRTEEGRRIARERGELGGRPKALSANGTRAKDFHAVIALFKSNESISDIVRKSGVSRPKVYEILKGEGLL